MSDTQTLPEVHVIGELEHGTQFDTHQGEGIFVEYNVSVGDQWWDITKSAQQTQTAYPDEENEVVFNHPVDLHFATASIAEWPRLNFQVYKLDVFGRMDPLSVGSLNLPCNPGTYQLACRTWSPLSQRSQEDVYGYYVGGRPQLVEPIEVLDRRSTSTNPERSSLITETSGTLFLNVDILFRNVPL
ncbi:unnamed protein product [Amoebophrya sp. A120]|nr:unnamed protein product [Amoebophrya sp. A120]|eukprot:GSA120T00005471001.1